MPASKSSHSIIAQHQFVSFPPIFVLLCFNMLALSLCSLFQFLPHSFALLPVRKEFQCWLSSGCEEPLTDENSFSVHTAEANWIWYHWLSKCTQANIRHFPLSSFRRAKIGAIIRVENFILWHSEQVAPPTLKHCYLLRAICFPYN